MHNGQTIEYAEIIDKAGNVSLVPVEEIMPSKAAQIASLRRRQWIDRSFSKVISAPFAAVAVVVATLGAAIYNSTPVQNYLASGNPLPSDNSWVELTRSYAPDGSHRFCRMDGRTGLFYRESKEQTVWATSYSITRPQTTSGKVSSPHEFSTVSAQSYMSAVGIKTGEFKVSAAYSREKMPEVSFVSGDVDNLRVIENYFSISKAQKLSLDIGQCATAVAKVLQNGLKIGQAANNVETFPATYNIVVRGEAPTFPKTVPKEFYAALIQ